MSSANHDVEFTNTCDAIRRNDPSVTWFDVESLHRGYGYDLGAALVGNNHVSKLDLSLNDLFDFRDPDVDRIMPLVRYIATSTTLRFIQVWAEYWAPDEIVFAPLVGRILLAAMKVNPNISEFWIGTTLPSAEFSDYLREAAFLRILKLDLAGTAGIEFDDVQLVAEALGANRSLEYLELNSEDGADFETAKVLLQGLYAHPTLSELDFSTQREDSSEYFDVLSGLIRSTTVLQKLSLSCLYFDANGTEAIVDALNYNQSIFKLSLLHCAFAIERGGELLRKCLSQKGATRKIRELHVTGGRHCRPEDAETYAKTAGLLDTQSMDIERVTMDPIDQTLAGYIPGCVRLRTLTFAHVVDYSVLATAVRKNGSLHSCGVGAFNDDLRRMDVYCERNKRLPELLVEHRQNESNEASDFASFPPFFTVARHAPRTAPNALLSGLLTTSISISGKETPERGVKRAADSPSNRCTKKRRKAQPN